MAFLHRVLEPPSYGWDRKPTPREVLVEWFGRINVFENRKNWVPATGWATTFLLAIPCTLFFVCYFSFGLWALGFAYGVVGLGSYGTIWFHRYCTHRAYEFRGPFWRFVTRNLVIKVIPEETYVVSHYVHHALSDAPGDPYNAQFGSLYGFFADTNQQPIHRNLSPEDYARVVAMLDRTGHRANSYEQYQHWGSVIHPLRCWTHIVLNWAFWYAVFFLVGGPALVCAMFGGACIWALGIRSFNYAGHGGGQLLHQDGQDFDRSNLSINQWWPGLVAGEWHNNHHLFPRGARSGFLPHQFDIAWAYIKLLHRLGAVTSYLDFKPQFLARHYEPYQAGQRHSQYRGPALIQSAATAGLLAKADSGVGFEVPFE